MISSTGHPAGDRPDTGRVDGRGGEELAHQQLETDGALGDPVDDPGSPGRGHRGVLVLQHVRQDADRGERVVELVGGDGHDDVLMLQGGLEFSFGLPAVGDVAQRRDVQALALQRGGGSPHLHDALAPARQHQLHLGRPAGHDGEAERGADELACRAGEQFLRGPVADPDDPLVVHGHDPVRRGGHDQLADVTLSAYGQTRLSAVPFV